jgi:ipoprotein LpqH
VGLVENRFVAIATAAAVVVAGVAGCSSAPKEPPQPSGALPPNTAHITVNGQDAGTTHNVKCDQVEWFHTIETGTATSGVMAQIESGDTVTAKSVQLRSVGGFTGSFWAGKVGKGEAALLGNTFKISGTAVGSNDDKPNTPTTATFEIRANC